MSENKENNSPKPISNQKSQSDVLPMTSMWKKYLDMADEVEDGEYNEEDDLNYDPYEPFEPFGEKVYLPIVPPKSKKKVETEIIVIDEDAETKEEEAEKEKLGEELKSLKEEVELIRNRLNEMQKQIDNFHPNHQ